MYICINSSLLTGECWIPPKNMPCIQGQRRSPTKMLGGVKPGDLCPPGDPTETETELCLSVFCGGMGQQWTAAGQGLWVQQIWVWNKSS